MFPLSPIQMYNYCINNQRKMGLFFGKGYEHKDTEAQRYIFISYDLWALGFVKIYVVGLFAKIFADLKIRSLYLHMLSILYLNDSNMPYFLSNKQAYLLTALLGLSL